MTFRASDAKGASLAARIVLADCRVCLSRLEQEDDHTSFRINWVAMCAMLRAVGHVLNKVDGPAGSEARRALIADKYRIWTKSTDAVHAVFRDFIDNERNAVLKEYRFGYNEALIQVELHSVESGERVVAALPPGVYRPYDAGHFNGVDTRDLALEAIEWWDRELKEIEALD